MKVRNVIIIFQQRLPVGGGAEPYHFNMVVPEHPAADFDSRQVLGGLLAPRHPEDPEPEPGSTRALASEYVEALAPLMQQMHQAQIVMVPPGTHWHDGCVEFQTQDGETLIIPLAGVARILLGPVRDRQP